MPQMAPMNWLTLFIYFSLIFILTILMNYYFNLFFYKHNNSSDTSTSPANKLNQKIWKW